MTPPARIAAAAGVLDAILVGDPAERALLGWSRGARYAGSKDRAAVRDLVFQALRRRRSLGWIGGRESGRGLMLGLLRSRGDDPSSMLTGEGHALAVPGREDAGASLADAPRAVRLDLPDWLMERFDASLGDKADAVGAALRDRAPAFLRVNPRRGTRDAALRALDQAGISATCVTEVENALQVTDGASKIKTSAAYLSGAVEIQDASSQAAVLRLPLHPGDRILDLCAGGGGKSLAMGARLDLTLAACDADPVRMSDLPARAARAGLDIIILDDPAKQAPYDLVLVDAPCSGSGTWRRAPYAKWRLTPKRLDELVVLQRTLMDRGAALVAPGGFLAFATCSVLREEGRDQVEAFLRRSPSWVEVDRYEAWPSQLGDGFFQEVLSRR